MLFFRNNSVYEDIPHVRSIQSIEEIRSKGISIFLRGNARIASVSQSGDEECGGKAWRGVNDGRWQLFVRKPSAIFFGDHIQRRHFVMESYRAERERER